MVWKTNFDQIPYQELLESRQQKSISTSSNSSSSSNSQSYSNNSKSSSNFNVNNNVNNNNVIHARPNSVINTLTQRDGSPITIPLNESVVNVEDDDNHQQVNTRYSDPTANAIASATSAPRSNSGSNLHQSRPNSKKLAYSNGNNNNNNNNNSNSSNGTVTPGSGSLLKKLTANNNNEIEKNSMPNISNTLEHIVQQLDILTQVKNYFLFIVKTSILS